MTMMRMRGRESHIVDHIGCNTAAVAEEEAIAAVVGMRQAQVEVQLQVQQMQVQKMQVLLYPVAFPAQVAPASL